MSSIHPSPTFTAAVKSVDLESFKACLDSVPLEAGSMLEAYFNRKIGVTELQLIVVVVADNVAVRVSNNFQQRNLYPIVMQSR